MRRDRSTADRATTQNSEVVFAPRSSNWVTFSRAEEGIRGRGCPSRPGHRMTVVIAEWRLAIKSGLRTGAVRGYCGALDIWNRNAAHRQYDRHACHRPRVLARQEPGAVAHLRPRLREGARLLPGGVVRAL